MSSSKSAARHMIARQAGVIMTRTPEPARLPLPLVGGTQAAVFLASDRASATEEQEQ